MYQDWPLLQHLHLLRPQPQLPRQPPCPLRPCALQLAASSPAQLKPSKMLQVRTHMCLNMSVACDQQHCIKLRELLQCKNVPA